ncbi:MAG TPA: fumarylacetoacetate hydrolase family protein [Oligoflexia bacterium]|nr:fumarylacetoacetate hydrolase family protein [Oligoflexia bacterium]HMR25656.1 fumarylacetoacetate hydrolase family protein [Oligoflexia bacterium]
MKLISYLNQNQQERLGLYIKDEGYYDMHDTAKHIKLDLPQDMQSFLNHNDTYFSKVQDLEKILYAEPEKFKPADVHTLLSPVPHPPSCRDAYAFRQHVETMRANRGADMIPEFDQFPVFYFTNHNAVFGEGPIDVYDDHLDKLDFELEIAAVIGKGGKNIPANKADEHIFGFMIMNDLSARTLQMQELKLSLGPAKGKDFANCFGPWLVSKDELKAFAQDTGQGLTYNLEMKATLNGELVSQGNMDSMHWTFAQIIERVSYGVNLFPGDIIGSGTVGTGCLGELNGTAALKAKKEGKSYEPIWLKNKDQIDLEITGLGKLSNTLVHQKASYHILK